MSYQIDEEELNKQLELYVIDYLNKLFNIFKNYCKLKCAMLKNSEHSLEILDGVKDLPISTIHNKIIELLNAFPSIFDINKLVDKLNKIVFFMRLVEIHFDNCQEYILGNYVLEFGKFDFNDIDNLKSLVKTLNESEQYLKFIPIVVLEDPEIICKLIELSPSIYNSLPFGIAINDIVIKKYLEINPLDKSTVIQQLKDYYSYDYEGYNKKLSELQLDGFTRNKTD